MSRPHRRALVWLARHPTMLLVAVAFTASVAVAVVGDFTGIADSAVMGDFDVEPTDGTSGGGPNIVEDD